MRTQYAKSLDDVSLAYQVLSDVGPTLLCVPGAISNLLFADAEPAGARLWERMARFCRVVRGDARDPYAPASGSQPLVDWDEFFADVDSDFEKFSRRFAETILPSGRAEGLGDMADFFRATASPQSLRSLWQGIVGLDLRPVLAGLGVPTLVLHSRGDRHHPLSHGRYLAEHIRGARYVELATDAHVPGVDESVAGEMLTSIEEFLTGSVHHTADRRFACVLFTDIASSTEGQRARGDRAWRDLLQAWEAATRRLAEQYTGRVVKFQGDGCMAAFPTPGEALRAARAMVGVAGDLGLQLRAGLHAGEVYEVGDDLFGTCVNTAARVCELADPGEILVTSVIEGLVEGSGMSFDVSREADLRGIGKRRLLRLGA